jgi:hypothetical protein
VAIRAAKAATAVRKPVSTFIPRMAALLLVGVVLVSELVVDAAAVVGVTAVVTVEVEDVAVFVVEPVEEVVELMLNWLD